VIPNYVLPKTGEAAKCPGCGKAVFIPAEGMTSRYCATCATSGRMSHREWHLANGQVDPGFASWKAAQDAQESRQQDREPSKRGRWRNVPRKD
jgi:hypothetical protein